MSLSRIELNEHIPPQGRADLRLTVKRRDRRPGAAGRREGRALRRPRCRTRRRCARPADRDQIVQVIQNLAENAVKYAPAGSSVVIEVLADVSADAAMAPRQLGAAHLSLLTPDHAADQRYVAAARRRRRSRHRPRAPAAADRAVLPGRGPEGERAAGHRPRPRHRQAHRQPPPRRADRRERAGRGRRLQRLPADRAARAARR